MTWQRQNLRTRRGRWGTRPRPNQQAADPGNLFYRHDITQTIAYVPSIEAANNTPAENPHTAQLYSRLDQAEQHRNPNGLLHFRQTYPLEAHVSGSPGADIVLEWVQASNPFFNGTNPAVETVTGYKLLSRSIPDGIWGGLARSNATGAYYDNNPNSTNWWGPIGQRRAFTNDTFPAIFPPQRTARIVELEILNEPFQSIYQQLQQWEATGSGAPDAQLQVSGLPAPDGTFTTIADITGTSANGWSFLRLQANIPTAQRTVSITWLPTPNASNTGALRLSHRPGVVSDLVLNKATGTTGRATGGAVHVSDTNNPDGTVTTVAQFPAPSTPAQSSWHLYADYGFTGDNVGNAAATGTFSVAALNLNA